MTRRYVSSVSVVALGALCDLVPPEEFGGTPGGGASFSVVEFAVLDDGTRMNVRQSERGWTEWATRAVSPWHPVPDDWGERLDSWAFVTREGVVQSTLNVVMPDDDDDPDDHPYEWLAQRLAEQGLQVRSDQLRGLPYRVEFTPRLEEKLVTLDRTG